MAFVAGPYAWYVVKPGSPTTTYGLGIVSDAPRLREKPISEPIKADAAGGMTAEWLNMGKQATLDIVFAEYDNLGVAELLQTAGGQGVVNSIGCPMVANFSRIIYAIPLSSCITKHNVFIARSAAISPDFPVELLLGSRLRQVPLQLTLYPYEYALNSGNIKTHEFSTDLSAPYIPADATNYAAHRTLSAFLSTVT